MSQNKTLVAYESKGGATEEAAKKIADVLRGKFNLEVDLVDLKKQKTPDLAQYLKSSSGEASEAAKSTIKP